MITMSNLAMCMALVGDAYPCSISVVATYPIESSNNERMIAMILGRLFTHLQAAEAFAAGC